MHKVEPWASTPMELYQSCGFVYIPDEPAMMDVELMSEFLTVSEGKILEWCRLEDVIYFRAV